VPPADFDVNRYWEERLGRHEGLSGVGWLGLGESVNRWMYAVRARVFRRAVREGTGNRVDRLRVLDVGSGTGFYLGQWHRLGVASLTGSDLTRVAVERLGARYPWLEVAQLDITAEAVPLKGPYDAISAMDVLFHIVDERAYRQALANLSSLLPPAGLLLFSENMLGTEAPPAGHQVSRTERRIGSLLDEVGLERVATRRCSC
jgi:2-polyprenyl-3-methyl-5-hydroxy-6-metoxy-1,4-benzoquinol methylase